MVSDEAGLPDDTRSAGVCGETRGGFQQRARPSPQQRADASFHRRAHADDDAAGSSFPVDSLWAARHPPVSQPGDDPLLGRTLGDVTLVRFIAEGGIGHVYEGEQKNPRRSVAVKVMRPGLGSAEIVRRFQREATLLGSLRHPRIIDFGVARPAA